MADGQMQLVVRHIRRMAGQADDVETTDAQLLDRFCRRRDDDAFTLLVQRYGPMVMGVCQRVLQNSHDAEDVFQATFLILARKASSLHQPKALGGWLHEVALRTAIRVRGQAVVRRQHEGRVKTMAQQDWMETVAWRDLQPVLDEEVQRLPKTYRAPFVLCYLEGKTYEETAAQLGCRPGTISRRLAKAREVLRNRLTRRGLTLPAGLLAFVLSEYLISKPVDASLLARTVRSAGIGAAPAAGVSELVEEGVRVMTASKVKHAVGILLLAGFLGAGLLLSHQAFANKGGTTSQNKQLDQIPVDGQPQAKANQPEPQQTTGPKQANLEKPKKSETKRKTRVAGRILNAKGKPAAGAWVAVMGQPKPATTLRSGASPFALIGQAKTDAKGEFKFDVFGLSREKYWNAYAVSWSPGHVPVTTSFNPDLDKANVRLWLVKDRPMRGRLVNLQGQPVAGVPVHVIEAEGSTGFFQQATRMRLHQPMPKLKAWPRPALTDKDGRFTLRGVGNGWTVKLEIAADNIARQSIVINPPENYQQRFAEQRETAKPDWNNKHQQFTWAVLPARTLEGTMTAQDTGKPIPYARLVAFVGRRTHTVVNEHMTETRADDQGRYRITPRYGKFFNVIAYPPSGQPYLLRNKRFTWTDEASIKKRFDVSLRRAVMVSGTVTEAGTGKPVAGASVEYFAHKKENPFFTRELAPTLSSLKQLGFADENGRYQVPVLPGKGFLLINTNTQDYVRHKISPHKLATVSFKRHWQRPQGLVALDLPEKIQKKNIDVELRRGATITGRIVDPDGKPVRSTVIVHRSYIEMDYSHRNMRYRRADGDRFTLTGINPDKGEMVYFMHASRQLGKMVKLSGNDAGKPLTIKLERCGAVKARLVEENGKPKKDWRPALELVITPGPSWLRFDPNTIAADSLLLEHLILNNLLGAPRPDESGYYTLQCLVPGARFNIYATTAQRSLIAIDNDKCQNITIRSGELRDLGDIVAKRAR